MKHQIRRTPSKVALVALGAVLGVAVATCNKNSSHVTQPISDAMTAFAPAPAFAQVAGADGRPVVLADIAERVVPSVVNISVRKKVELAGRSPMLNDPMFRHFFGPQMPREHEQMGLGSGVIVSKGIVLTNNHVVSDAAELEVTLSDGREIEAEVAGTDPRSDLAVLKLKGDLDGVEPLPLGSSSSMRLGDVVLAVGNPFGVGQTVTMGIVSAKGRSRVGIVDYEDFIQTDAAINPGNSGGALVNTRGELVGINTAILSRSGGYMGVGFAIPIDMARPIMDSLIKNGKVSRGWLGVSIQDLDSDLAQAMGIKQHRGVLISDVIDGSPAEKAGVKRGDVVIELDGAPLKSTGQLRNTVAALGPDKVTRLGILRNNQRKTIEVKLGDLPDSGSLAQAPEKAESELYGLRVDNLDANYRQRLGLDESVKGVVITEVAPRSPAARAGLRPGDVIAEVDRNKVASTGDFSKAIDKADGPLLLLVRRGEATTYVALRK